MMERRVCRSPLKSEALTLFLEEQRRRLAVRSVVVRTREGRLLGAAGPVPTDLEDGGIWEMHAGAVDVVVTSHPGRLSHDLGEGVKRILMQ